MGLLTLAIGAVVAASISEHLAVRIFDEEHAMDKQGFEWTKVTSFPEVWHYTDGDAVAAKVTKSGPTWRWATGIFVQTSCGVAHTLEAAQDSAEEALNE